MKREWLRGNTRMLMVLVGCCAALFGVLRYHQDTSPLYSTIHRLRSGDAPRRLAAARELGLYQLGADAAVPALAEAVRDPDEEVRSAAIASLRLFGPQAAAAVPALCNALRDERPGRLRSSIIEALGMIGSPAAVPSLVVALEDQDERIRLAAALALRRIGAGASAAILQLIARLERDAAEDIRFASLEAPISLALTPGQEQHREAIALARFKALRRDPSTKVRTLAASLGHDPQRGPAPAETSPDPRVRWLGHDGPRFAFEVPALIAALGDPSGEVRLAASNSLAEIGISDPRVVRALCQAVRDHRGSREFAEIAECLVGRVRLELADGEAASASAKIQSALQAILGLLEVEDTGVRCAAVRMLIRMFKFQQETQAPAWREPARIAAQTVLAMLEDEHEDPGVRRSIAEHWWYRPWIWDEPWLGDERAVRALGKALSSKDATVRAGALSAMMSCRLDWRPSAAARAAWRAMVPTLIAALADPLRDVRYGAAGTLVALGPEGHAAHDALQKLAHDDPDPDVRGAVAQALGKIGPDARAAVPALRRLADYDSDAVVHGYADGALKAILGTSANSGREPPRE